MVGLYQHSRDPQLDPKMGPVLRILTKHYKEKALQDPIEIKNVRYYKIDFYTMDKHE